MIRLMIGGSRHYVDYRTLCKLVDDLISEFDEDVTIISGEARGTDRLAKRYAEDRKLDYEGYPAQWEALGKKAGIVRNEKMIRLSTHAILFWDMVTPGTKHALTFSLNHLGADAVSLVIIPGET